jgi:hypothetical protein
LKLDPLLNVNSMQMNVFTHHHNNPRKRGTFMRFETKAVHSRRTIESTGTVTMPLHPSTTFELNKDWSPTNEFVYSRKKSE